MNTHAGHLVSHHVADHDGGTCRICSKPLKHSFADLGMSPLCESFVPADQVDAMEPFYPLHAFVCATQMKQELVPLMVASLESLAEDPLRVAQETVRYLP